MDYTSTPTVVAASPFDAAADSEALHTAMKGMGTDEQEIIDILTARTNSQRQQIKTKYEALFERDLIHDLKGDLGGTFEDVIVALMISPVEFLCKQLNSAMTGMGTNEETLVEILCTKSNEEIQEIVTVYEAMFERPLAEQMCGETSGHFRRLLTMIVTGVRDDIGKIHPEKAKEQATELYAAGEAKLGTDEEVFNRIMAHASFHQLRLVFEEYKQLSGQTIEQAIKHEMGDELHDAMMAIVECVQSPAAFFANRLYKAMDGAGTDDTTLIRIIVSRSEIDLGTIKDEFERIYNRTLFSAVTILEKIEMPGALLLSFLNLKRRQLQTERLKKRYFRDLSNPMEVNETSFISLYRLNKTAFKMVLDKVGPQLTKSSIPETIQLAATLRFLAVGSYQGVIANDMNISLGREPK